jgi:hypothetical protein
VRVQLVVEGGFAVLPGLRKPVDIDLSAVPAAQAEEVQQLLEQANFFDLPDRIDPPAGAADYREYVVTADDGTRCHTVRCPDFAAPPELLALVACLQALR